MRHGSFISGSNDAVQLWKSVKGVSNAGRKKGRGNRGGKNRTVDLNKGRPLGSGKANILWPGLNSPVIKGRDVVKMGSMPPNPKREAELIQLRDESNKGRRFVRLAPLQRGYSGGKMNGQKMGPPDPVGDYKFEGFESILLEIKMVTNMTGTLGRKQRYSALVAVGNRNGLAGYGFGKSLFARTAIRNAKNKAAQRLMYIPRYNEQTVYHNMFAAWHRSFIFIHKKEQGYGLRMHRVLKSICELAGIKDLHCKAEASTRNYGTLTKGFFKALATQETHSQVADRLNMMVVELREERDNLPVVVASPSDGIISDKELTNEEEDVEMDFERLYYGGKTEYVRPDKGRFYEKYKSFKKKTERMHKKRGQMEAKLLRDCNLW